MLRQYFELSNYHRATAVQFPTTARTRAVALPQPVGSMHQTVRANHRYGSTSWHNSCKPTEELM
jgi:hypothetical protein